MSNLIDDIRYDVKNWWWFLISGLLSIGVGIAIYARPVAGYLSLSILFSLFMLANGFFQVVFASANRKVLKGWGWILVSGIIDLALGTYLSFYPGVTMVTLPYFVGFWLIFRSFYLMGTSIDLQSLGVSGWGWLLFGGIAMLIFGCLTVYFPAAGAISIIAVSGSAFIIGGISNFYLAFQLKSVKTQLGKVRDASSRIKENFVKVG